MSKIKRYQEDFNYYLDDLHGDTIICGITFSASDILMELDPIGYKEEFNNYLDNIGVDLFSES